MAKIFYVESTKAKGLRFRIMKLNKETMQATLQGDTGVPFERDISQASLDKYGFKIAVAQSEETADV